MLNILKKSEDKYSIIVNDVETAHLSMEQLFKVMNELEVEFEEIELAVLELMKNDHKLAHFGVHKRFIFTKEKV